MECTYVVAVSNCVTDFTVGPVYPDINDSEHSASVSAQIYLLGHLAE